MDALTLKFTAHLLGPLDSHRNYIAHVALANAQDYFELKKAHGEQQRNATSDEYNKELRYFLNAIESVNNIPEYLYFDKHPTRTNPLGVTAHPCGQWRLRRAQ